MPGASFTVSTPMLSMPLVSSLSAPLRRTSARSGEPEPRMAAEKPAAIDSTDTKTTTTPAMPTIATPDEPSRAGIVRRLSAITASVWRIHFATSASPERFGDPQPHGAPGGQRAGQHAHRQHQREAEQDVLRRQH